MTGVGVVPVRGTMTADVTDKKQNPERRDQMTIQSISRLEHFRRGDETSARTLIECERDRQKQEKEWMRRENPSSAFVADEDDDDVSPE